MECNSIKGCFLCEGGMIDVRLSKVCLLEGHCGRDGVVPVQVNAHWIMREGLTFEGCTLREGSWACSGEVHFEEVECMDIR